MKRIFIFISLVALFSVVAFAQDNHLIYLRYDYQSYNSGRVVQELNKIRHNENQNSILYFEGKCYQGNECENLTSSKWFLANSSVYEPVLESRLLDSLFVVLFDETVRKSADDINLVGMNDHSWEMTFIMHQNSSLSDLIQLIDINELINRGVRLTFLLFDDDANFTTQNYDELLSSFSENKLVLNF